MRGDYSSTNVYYRDPADYSPALPRLSKAIKIATSNLRNFSMQSRLTLLPRISDAENQDIFYRPVQNLLKNPGFLPYEQ